MRVFEILGAVNDYQYLLPRDRKLSEMLEDGPLWFDGRSKKANWTPPEMMLMNPKRESLDIWDVNSRAAFAASPRAFPLIQEFFEMAGEILPLPFYGQKPKLLNVTECVDCLDGDRCRWVLDEGDERLAVDDS
jgi:hypothetical protein